MNTLSLWAGDSATMLRRNLRHMLRYPSVTLLLVGMPIVLLLLFVYVFGETLGAGLGASGGRAAYADYVAPGIILLTVAAVAQGTSISVAMDMTGGIISRFRTMAISRASVLTGHVLGAMTQTMLAVAVVIVVAMLGRISSRRYSVGVDRRIRCSPDDLLVYHLAYRRARPGYQQRRGREQPPHATDALAFLRQRVRSTDSMPAALRLFAEYQPFTPFIETLRGLLLGTPIGNSAALSVVWCAGITLVGFLWARALFNRDPIR